MTIDKKKLIELGAIEKTYRKNEVIFHEGSEANYYFQLETGKVRLINTSHENKEYTQGSFEGPNSFGEAPLFIDKPYPSTAIAESDSSIIRLSRDRFLRFVEGNVAVQKQIIICLAEMIYMKSIKAKTLAQCDPEQRILMLLNMYKEERQLNGKSHIDITRRELANATGLAIETVIRTLSKMKDDGKVEIINKKLYY